MARRKSGSDAASLARAAELQSEIEELVAGGSPRSPASPESPRTFIERRMAEMAAEQTRQPLVKKRSVKKSRESKKR